MGQKKVQGYKLLKEVTIEKKIAKLQDNKRDLIESIKPGGNIMISFGMKSIYR